jgi:general secretion pathway protein I
LNLRRSSGFTLLEVLAAIALLAIAFAIGLSALGGAARNASRAAALDTAMERAQSLLAGQGLATPLENESKSGTFADGMGWTLKVQALPRSAPTPGDAVNAVEFTRSGGVLMAQAAAIVLYQLDVAIEYGDHRTLRLSTERAQAAPDTDQ